MQKDREDGTLSENERNCIKFRQNEKITLDILSSASFMIIKLLTMDSKGANEYAQSLPEFIQGQLYFLRTVLPFIKEKRDFVK